MLRKAGYEMHIVVGPLLRGCLTLIAVSFWGGSSDGRAPVLQAGSRRFEPCPLHQTYEELMKIIRNKFIPFRGFAAINLFGVLFVRPETVVTKRLLNHELIHTAQMKELWYIPFYILYVLEWLYWLTKSGNAYHNISFEREAYTYDYSDIYLDFRQPFAMWQ